MYSLDKQRAKVKVFERSNVLWVRFTWNGKQHRLTTGLPNTKDGNKAAQGIAAQIESDIIFQRLTEERLYGYLGKEAPGSVKPKELKELWDEFVEYQRGQLAETTFKNSFASSVRRIKELIGSGIDIEKKREVANFLNTKYSYWTIKKFYIDLSAFGNWLVDSEYRESSPYVKLKKLLPPEPERKRSKKAYSEEEAVAIINAFRENTFASSYSAYDDRHLLNVNYFGRETTIILSASENPKKECRC